MSQEFYKLLVGTIARFRLLEEILTHADDPATLAEVRQLVAELEDERRMLEASRPGEGEAP